MNPPDIRECGKLAGEIAVDVYDELWAKNRWRYGNPGVEFELIGSDEADQFGQTDSDGKFHPLPMDDPYLTILRRVSDGQAFEIEVEVTVRPVERAPESGGPIPGQMALDEVTS